MIAQQRLFLGRSVLRLLCVRQQARRVALRSTAQPRMADASARAPELPDAICVHCGQRFNSAHLAYGFDARKLSGEARGVACPLRALLTRFAGRWLVRSCV